MKVLTKGEIRESAIKELTYKGVHCWKQNNLAVRKRAFIGERGLPDVIGYTRDGLFCACEIKTFNDRLSEDQIKFLQNLKAAGGIAIVAKQNINGQVVLEYL